MTKRTLYSLINQHAKSWWHYADLRKKGQHAEARKLERQSIRRQVEMLRACKATPGGYIGLGRGGASIYTNGCTTSGGDNTYYRELGLHVGLVVIDSTTVPDALIYDTINFPMVAVGREPDKLPSGVNAYGSMSYAPLEYVAALYKSIGAAVFNLNLDPVTENQAVEAHKAQLAEIRSRAKPESVPVRKPVVRIEGNVEIDLQDLHNEGADGACLACGEYAHGVEPDASEYKCGACGAFKVMGAENILLIYS